MQIDTIAGIRASTQAASSATQKKNAMGKDDFLALLVAQLKNQSPFAPVDDKDFMAQMAQFSVLEQVQELNQGITSLITLQQITQAYSLIGRKVETNPDSSGKVLSGVVTGVDLSGETVELDVGGKRVDVSDVARVTP